jgi:hypothetical protein
LLVGATQVILIDVPSSTITGAAGLLGTAVATMPVDDAE